MIYLNGNLVKSIESANAEILPAPSENLYIGSSPAFISQRVIDAGLAEIRIWNIARTDSEIKEFAAQRLSGSETGLAAYWPIDEGEGQTIYDSSPSSNDGILGGTPVENNFDPLWTEGVPPIVMKDILQDYNGSFEDGLNFWRFFEVPNALGSSAKITHTEVVDGANAVKITYVEPDAALADRGFDNWDANMALEPGAEYFCEFWAKADSADEGQLKLGYGFFDEDRNVLSEAGESYTLTNSYQKYEFNFTAPEGTSKGWIAFRWKHPTDNKHMPGVLYFDYIQLWTEDKTVGVEDIAIAVPDKFELKQNYPNPFNPTTTIQYNLKDLSDVTLNIFNLRGQLVKKLVSGKQPAGNYDIQWNAEDEFGLKAASGLYIYQLLANSKGKKIVKTRKMLLIK